MRNWKEGGSPGSLEKRRGHCGPVAELLCPSSTRTHLLPEPSDPGSMQAFWELMAFPDHIPPPSLSRW